MGLSDSERISGIYQCMPEIVKLASQIDINNTIMLINDQVALTRLLEKCANPWHMILKGNSNSSGWFTGSPSTGLVGHSNSTPWSIAIYNTTTNESREQEQSERDDEFDPFDYFISIKGLLYEWDSSASRLFELYQISETMQYYLRRYSDDLRARYSEVDNLISEIQGTCYRIFSENKEFAKAYVAYQIAEVIYGGHFSFNDNDWVRNWLLKHHSHHNLAGVVKRTSLKELLAIHKEIYNRHYKANKKYAEISILRVQAFLMIAGRSFHYNHVLNSLIKTAKENGTADADVKRIEELFKKNVAAKKEYEEENQLRVTDSTPQMNIHGDY